MFGIRLRAPGSVNKKWHIICFCFINQSGKAMKSIIITAAAVSMMIMSCETIPDAHFSVDKIEAYIGEEIYFTNQSYNSVYFEWDFGDGTWSDVINPVHTYNSTGVFEVMLTAESKSGNIDRAYQTIEVFAPTMLEVEVLEWEYEYPVANANVRIYGSLYDWDEERNMITQGNTGSGGKVLFNNLQQRVYYLDVWEENHNNWDLRDYDPGTPGTFPGYYITTDMLVPNEINRFIAWVDYTGAKGSPDRDRKMVIRKLERKPKL